MKICFKIVLKTLVAIFCVGFILFFVYFFIGQPKPAEKINWGVNFSQKHAQYLGLDWKETYLALLNDLGVKNLKIAAYWDLIEPEEGKYNFEDLDWQIKKVEEKGAKLILVIGMKVPRWPECHEPDWIKNKELRIKNKKLLEYIEKVVDRYKNLLAIRAWQVENEPFFFFGECPSFDKELLKKEIDLVKSIDTQKRPIIISESGEFSSWIRAAKAGDIIGITMYRKVWFTLPNFLKKNLGGLKELGFYVSYPFPPIFYWRKAQLIKNIFGKKVICIELQAEPWGPRLLYDLSLEEQEKTMDLKQFQKNIEFAKKTGLDEIYLWGAEWWYWLKTKQNQPEIWQEAKKLFP